MLTAKIDYKIGSWYTNESTICYCVGYSDTGDPVFKTHNSFRDVFYFCEMAPVLRHLPNCTGFDYVEPKIPDGVYYNVEADNFFNMLSKKGMGGKFWQEWKDYRDLFPKRATDWASKIDLMTVFLKEWVVWDYIGKERIIWDAVKPEYWENSVATGNVRTIVINS